MKGSREKWKIYAHSHSYWRASGNRRWTRLIIFSSFSLSLSAPTLYSLSIALLINSIGRFFPSANLSRALLVRCWYTSARRIENSGRCSFARSRVHASLLARTRRVSRDFLSLFLLFFPPSPSFVFSPRAGLAHARERYARARTRTKRDKVWLRIFAYAKEQIRCARLRMPRVRTGSKSDIVCEQRACSKRVCV